MFKLPKQNELLRKKDIFFSKKSQPEDEKSKSKMFSMHLYNSMVASQFSFLFYSFIYIHDLLLFFIACKVEKGCPLIFLN